MNSKVKIIEKIEQYLHNENEKITILKKSLKKEALTVNEKQIYG